MDFQELNLVIFSMEITLDSSLYLETTELLLFFSSPKTKQEAKQQSLADEFIIAVSPI